MDWFKRKNKQYFSYDHDIHSHILPGLDDGVKRVEDSVVIVKKMLELGVKQFSFTPHISFPSSMNTPEIILGKLNDLKERLLKEGIEIEAEKIPKIQRYIVKKCIESKKPVIIATQMLHTMIDHPRPTRAEVSDIANAVFSGTDAIMLSGETAYGDYPLEAVKVMSRVAEANESILPPDANRNLVRINNEITAALARVAVRMTTMLPIKAIVVDTNSGRTARYLSAFRGGLPVYARCYDEHVMRELALSFGVRPYFSVKPHSRDEFMRDIPQVLLQNGYQPEDQILVIGGSFGHVRGASFLEVCKISDIK